ncbi:hypothetical protein KEM55_002657 [Ascosphaera atra]|nr:hypothetical protein KEM55_002657 [Ascosphaera atra]
MAGYSVTSTLLEWLNSFPLATTVSSIDELSDGAVLWEILQDIDSQYFLGELPERTSSSDHWVQRWQNLKHIHKLLVSYMRTQNENGEIPSGLNTAPDLKAIAERKSVPQTCELLKLFLFAAISSPNAEAYIVTMQRLSTPTQEGLKNLIQEAQNPTDERLDELRDGAVESSYPTGKDVFVDPELRFEERVGKVIAENEKLLNEKKELEKDVDSLNTRLNRMQEQNDSLQDQLSSTEDRLTALKSGRADLIPTAKGGTRQQEELIATQEAKLTALQDEIDHLRMSVESLKVKNQRYQKLQDDYDEMKTERDGLARKANAAEKYRQKLQTSQDYEKENLALKKKVKDLEQQLKENDLSQRSASERDIELEEYRKLIPKIEQDRHEIQNMKKQLEFDNHALQERLESAEEVHLRDESLITELRERLGEVDSLDDAASGATTPTKSHHGTFHGDLESVAKRETQLALENEELRREVEKYKGENHDEDLEGLPENEAIRKLYHEMGIVREQRANAEARLQMTERQLSDAKQDLELVDKDRLEALHEIRAANSAELSQMRQSWDHLHARIRDLEAKLGASNSIIADVSHECKSLQQMMTVRETQLHRDQEGALDEMKKIFEEIAHRATNGDGEGEDSATASELFARFAQATRQGAEVLTKRAVVSCFSFTSFSLLIPP